MSNLELLRSTPVLKAADYERARSHYVDRLGYKVVEDGGTPPRFGIFRRGQSTLFVDSWHGGPAESKGGWCAYVHVTGLESLLDEFRAAGAEITRAIETTTYGMREFEIRDPDGNTLCFGEDIVP